MLALDKWLIPNGEKFDHLYIYHVHLCDIHVYTHIIYLCLGDEKMDTESQNTFVDF